ncbi:L,D-transpeptidase family protein [Shimia sp. R10_1]|uniref:L,D-transpeptidase family protein n=1 Tax=Shimia sp. R10_1 TaxID=2821095 RepID=UPI001AD9A9F4|nr:L,D-transpeptidase family protein [Shimia sp. R10_1]MBO9472393.1 L,D-transpeptidase family protein [Shimia sp. R10_1]
MLLRFRAPRISRSLLGSVAAAVLAASLLTPEAQAFPAFKQAVAETAARDDAIAAYYRGADFDPIWTGQGEIFLARRKALIAALSRVEDHALPAARYDVDGLVAQMASARSARDLGLVEVALSKAYLKYARDLTSGMLVPSRIDDEIVREIARRDRTELMQSFLAAENPKAFLRGLAPQTPEYTRLMKEKLRLQRLISDGGWGATVPVAKLESGDRGNAVIALRDRLIRMGFMDRSATASFDSDVENAVRAFQTAHGLEIDGVAGKGTITEINVPAETRLKSIMVAMERERWLDRETEGREILVNLTDFTAKIIDDGKLTFRTRSVVGKNQSDRRSPEFSDTMEHMVINPTWNVPRSIATKEYLPMLKKNPNAVSYLRLVNGRGQTVDRSAVDFSQFTTRNFPFDMKQSPGNRNALGLVKFMFPNRHNIYLHDTPQKALFKREVRAYSHGCIRLQQPFEFAYALLAKQEDNPKAFFQSRLKTGRETHVDLKQDIPVHIIYRTAYTEAKGPVQFRRDVYGRDGKIWKALENEGVALTSYQG